MPDEYDQGARAVISRAAEEARARGRHIGPGHLLLGFCHEDERDSEPVLAPAGITTDAVRAWMKEHDGHVDGALGGRSLYTPAARSALWGAHQEADGRRHTSISAHHLLLGLIRQAVTPAPEAEPDALAALTGDLEVDIPSLYTKVIARANSNGAGQGFPYLEADLTAHARLPGARERRLRHAAVIVGYVCLAALVIVLAPAGSRRLAGIAAFAVPIVLFLGRRAVGSARLYRFVQPVAAAEKIEVPGLRRALAPAGLREVSVFCASKGLFAARSWGASRRSGRVGMILLRPEMRDIMNGHSDLARYVTAHEAAHLARDDSMTADLAAVGLFSIAVIVLLTGPEKLWLLLPLAALSAAVRWRSELACDRIAVEATGRIAAARHVASLDWADEENRRRSRLPRLGRWLRARLRYPTHRMRRDAIARILAKQEQATGG